MDFSQDNDSKLTDEAGRLAALRRLQILGTPPEEEFERITDLAKSVFQAPIVAVSLIDADRQWFKSIRGVSAEETPRKIAFCDFTIRGREVLAVPDATKDERFAENPLVLSDPGIRSYLGVPLETSDGYNVGSLCILDTEPREFSAESEQLLRRFAGLVVNQMELRQAASRDPLTGVLSRRAFEEMASKELNRHRRHGSPSALVLFDIDHFKSINDRWGHSTGDAVLKAATAAVDGEIRLEDAIGRWGGEEFAVLLVGVAGDAAFTVSERLRSAVAEATIAEKPDIRVTASFGIADCSSDYGVLGDWVEAADRQLYQAKQGGRNRSSLGR